MQRSIKDGAGKTPTEIAPGTKVYELVEKLAKYLPEEQKIFLMIKYQKERIKGMSTTDIIEKKQKVQMK